MLCVAFRHQTTSLAFNFSRARERFEAVKWFITLWIIAYENVKFYLRKEMEFFECFYLSPRTWNCNNFWLTSRSICSFNKIKYSFFFTTLKNLNSMANDLRTEAQCENRKSFRKVQELPLRVVATVAPCTPRYRIIISENRKSPEPKITLRVALNMQRNSISTFAAPSPHNARISINLGISFAPSSLGDMSRFARRDKLSLNYVPEQFPPLNAFQ